MRVDWLRMRLRWKQSNDVRRPHLWTRALASANRATAHIGADTATDRAGHDTDSDRAANNDGADTETDSADPDTESDDEPNTRGVARVLEPKASRQQPLRGGDLVREPFVS